MDLGLDLWTKELALLMDQLGVRPETDVSTRGEPPQPAPTCPGTVHAPR